MGLFPFSIFPLILYVIAAYFLYDHANYIVTAGEPLIHPFWNDTVFDMTLVSGQNWALSNGDLIIVISVILLLFSVLRTASHNPMTVLGNIVMVLILCIYIVLFLTVDFAGTSVFFILTIIALVDTLITVSVSLVASHSDVDATHD